MTRLERVLLGLLLVGAWVLRASPFFRPNGIASWPVDYDEGVYVSAAGALAHGLLPWRDFVFLHPPGALLLFAPLTVLGPLGALLAARVLVTLIGTLSTWLIFSLVRRHAGLAGAFIGAALYATWPEVVVNERRALLEPLLNAAALGALLSLNRPTLRNAVLGLALLIKSWGALWLLGLTLATRSWKFLVAAVVVGVALLGLMPEVMREQLLLVHLTRPPDGDLDRLTRLHEMFVARSAVPLVVLVACAPWTWRHRREPVVQALTLVLTLFVLAFLSAAAFWNQYDAALAAPFAALCGLGAGFAWPSRWSAWKAAPLAVVLTVPALINVIGARHQAAPEQLEAAKALARLTTPATRVCAFEAFDALLADRWPAPPFDSYGQQLLDARRAGRFASTADAFQADQSQVGLREALPSCALVVRGWRGEWQMNAATRAWFDSVFEPVDQLHFVQRTSVQP